MKQLIICIIFLLNVSGTAVSQNIFSIATVPVVPGSRELTIKFSRVYNSQTLPINRFKISVVYGTDSLQVHYAAQNAAQSNPGKFCETAALQSNIKNEGTDMAVATVYLPHDNKPPNSTREKIFRVGEKIYFAWIREVTQTTSSTGSIVRSFVMPQPFTIGYMGDSYASGEGAKGSGWIDEHCHRSELSGGMLAIKQFINNNRNIAVSYVNTTCSGATVQNMYLIKQETKLPLNASNKKTQELQLTKIKNWLQSNKYDKLNILLCGGGGNDVGLVQMAIDGITNPQYLFAGIGEDKNVQKRIDEKLANINKIYESLMNEVNKINPDKIIWFNYPNLVTGNPKFPSGHDKALCKGSITDHAARLANPADCWSPVEASMTTTDFIYAFSVLLRLNTEIFKAAQKHNWDLVDIFKRAEGYGLCNCEGYFNSFYQSLLNQGDHNGALHPNAIGFDKIYKQPLLDRLQFNVSQIQNKYIPPPQVYRLNLDTPAFKALESNQVKKANETPIIKIR